MIGSGFSYKSSSPVSHIFPPMAAVDPLVAEAPAMALPGLARALISAGKLGQKSAEEISRKARANRNSFIA